MTQGTEFAPGPPRSSAVPAEPRPGGHLSVPPSPPSVPGNTKPPGGLCCPWLEGQAWNPGRSLSEVLVKARMGSRWIPQGMRLPDPGTRAVVTGPRGGPRCSWTLGSLSGQGQLECCMGTGHL